MKIKPIVKKSLLGIGIILTTLGGIYQNNYFIAIGGISLSVGEILMIYG